MDDHTFITTSQLLSSSDHHYFTSHLFIISTITSVLVVLKTSYMEHTVNTVAEISVSYRPAIADKPIIKSSLDAYTVLNQFFATDTIQLQEQFVALYLNRSNRVLGCYKLSVGGITGTVADIRLILSVALKTAATAIIIGHNHPSGNLRPSQADIQLSNKILEASKVMDIILYDHIILCAEDKYLSFADEGLI